MQTNVVRFAARRRVPPTGVKPIAVVLVGVCAAFIPESIFGVTRASEPSENPYLWEPRTKSVAVFKNGLGFFLREGEVDLRDGWCIARQVPPAAFGTLAVFAQRTDELVDVVGSGPGEKVEFDGEDAPSDDASKRNRLAAFKHLNISLHYKQAGKDRSAAGKLVSVGAEFVILEGPDNSFAVPLNAIRSVQVLDLPLRIHVVGEGETQPRRSKLGMAYLRKGITWIPEYSLTIIDENTAELTLRGTLVNEAEDIIHGDVRFVVGVPNFQHTDYLAPIAVGQLIRSIGAAVAPPEFQSQIMTRAALSNTIGAPQFDLPAGVVEQPVSSAPGDALAALGNLPQLPGPGGADFTVYTKHDLTVRRGEKAIVTLFKKTISYSHVYRWSPPAEMKHFLVLHNESSTAWTTGPVLAMSEGRPLSEGLLKYTPTGGKCEISVTTAVNIAHEKTESEIDRKLKAHSPSHNVFLDLVTLEGRLMLRNFEKTPVDVVVTAAVSGKPVSASGGGALSADPCKLRLLERAGTVRWAVKLDPGEAQTLTYRYERYVPSS
ncbi:MAG: hypothetical protein JSV19_03995 [Phycisphaerales bacterium]|nr:MAG: hypothetical protein JSV19_03995 [Phycisphaerales bacterium]